MTLTEARVREIVREELRATAVDEFRQPNDGLTQSIRVVGDLSDLADKLRELGNQARNLIGNLKLTHDGQPDHSLPRDVIESTLERFCGRVEVVDNHAPQHGGGGPGVGYLEVAPTLSHDASPSFGLDHQSVGADPRPGVEHTAPGAGPTGGAS